jgi:hypothetical protein
MDDKRRERLREALRMLTSAEQIVDAVCDKEQDCMDNYPENLQGTERYEQMEEAVDSLNDALEKIDDAKSSIESAIK